MIRILMDNHSSRPFEIAEPTLVNERTAVDILQTRFRRSPYLPLRKISCDICNGVIMLCGRVPTYYLKQLAQTIATSTIGVRDLINDLYVDYPDRWQIE